MPPTDPLAELDSLVRERMRLAALDKAAYERDSHRLNAQLMQGELNMGAAVLAVLERRQRADAAASAPDDDAEEDAGE